MSAPLDISKPVLAGGQAVIEGVMMRVPGSVATAVRRPDGSIAVRKERFISLTERSAFWKLPLLRGAVGLVEMLILGIRGLNFSAEVSLEGEGGRGGNGENGTAKKKNPGGLAMAVTLVLALLAGTGLFFLLPLYAATALFSIEQNPLAFNLVAGAIRVGILLGYLGGLSAFKELRRLFEYHGAEHKAVFALERLQPLTVGSAVAQSRFHPRCGTSFLLLVMVVAIALFSLIDAVLIGWVGRLTLLLRIVFHLPLIPVIGGVSYELIRYAGRHTGTLLGRLISAPGLWLQRITTREPDEEQLEVALVALRSALGVEEPAGMDMLVTRFGEVSTN